MIKTSDSLLTKNYFTLCVLPILDYLSSVWGIWKFQSIDNFQNRAIRYFLGVYRFVPLLAIYRDTGWIPSQYRRWINMVRFWNRILLFDSERITRQVFEVDYDTCIVETNGAVIWKKFYKILREKVTLTQNNL
jgi:hypothetical protein